MKSHILRTDEIGKFSVDSLLHDGENLIISLPHRVCFTLHRFGSVINLDCDLGWMPVDMIRVCDIDISEKNYKSAIRMNPEFMSIARSFDNSLYVGAFVRARFNPHSGISAGYFGEIWCGQVYVHLAEPTWEKFTNVEFSVFQHDYIEFFGKKCRLDEPSRTFVASLKLRGEEAHYFLFVEWWGDASWRYSKNFFFNNTEFYRKIEEYQRGGRNLLPVGVVVHPPSP